MRTETLRLLAFRYCLGRATVVVHDMVEDLIENWDEMKPFQEQIQDDIRFAIKNHKAGHDMDISQWERILDLEVT